MPSQSAAGPPAAERFLLILQRSIQLLNERIEPSQLATMAESFPSVGWEFPDIAAKVHLQLEADPAAIRLVEPADGDPRIRVVVDSSLMHEAAWGRTSFEAAFLTGKLKVHGLNPFQLAKFAPLVNPMLGSYRDAQEELDDSAT